MMTMGQNRIYVCGRNAYDNELAMYRHEGVACHRVCDSAPTFDTRPRFAYRISQGGRVRWATDPVDAYRARRTNPEATIDVVAVKR
ncbi:hypothetical protein [Oleispirillum naphthae]|uniref:hypothetical protein n=1 Tax=Oleispirillum naphthae TaxID=2838853 RepID=UPI00308247CE